MFTNASGKVSKCLLVTQNNYSWVTINYCRASVASERQHNQDLRVRILEFIAFYQNALHLTRVYCATNKTRMSNRAVVLFRVDSSEED